MKNFVEQTGLILEIRDTDYKVGASPLVGTIVNESGDWVPWKPEDEKQKFTFDTLSCATFSGENILENTINFLIDNDKLTVAQLEWLNKKGYIKNWKVNLSDRFNAIVSGTTDKGNTLQAVLDSFRNIGCIPEEMLPMGGNNQKEYLSWKVIKPAMLTLAGEFKKMFNVAYEWTGITKEELEAALKECPLNVVIYNGKHAVELINIKQRFDSYPPFLIDQDISGITYAMKVIVTVNKVTHETLRQGSKGEEVKELQEILGITVDGDFGPKTKKAVVAFQKANGLVADGIVGPKTWEKLEEPKETPKPDLSMTITRGLDEAGETLGEGYATNNGKELVFKTLELPWANNDQRKSCIPTGTYTCKYEYSQKYRCEVYRVMDVRGRDGILIHPGNYKRDTEGCILPGETIIDIDGDGAKDVTASRVTMNRICTLMEKKDFTLTIK